MSDYCDYKIVKTFYKCISLDTDKCYLFVGSNRYIRKTISKLTKNYKNDDDVFTDVTFEEKLTLYDYLSQNKTQNKETIENKIKKELCFDEYKENKTDLVFVLKDSINDDDSIQILLNKLCSYCFKNPIVSKYIYAYIKDKDKKIIPLGFKYEDNIVLEELFNNRKLEVDENFVDGEISNLVPMENQMSYILEEVLPEDTKTIYFCSIEEFLKAKDIQTNEDTLYSFLQDNDNDILIRNSIFNGAIRKYWPFIKDSLEILEYDSTRESIVQKYKEIKETIARYSLTTNFLESEYFLNETVECKSNRISLMKIVKEDTSENIVYLTKLFRDYHLNSECLFAKLVLENQDDQFYKLYRDSISYNGDPYNEERFVNQRLCSRWETDFLLQNSFGYRYLHKDNVIIFKIYESELQMYTSLVINLNGTIEFILDDNDKDVTNNDIVKLLDKCNEFILFLNKQTMYSLDDIQLFDLDIFTNKNSDTKLEFMNTQITFPKELFEDENKNILPDWSELFRLFMVNQSSYMRLYHIEEKEDPTKNEIIARYKKVNNYSTIKAIHSYLSFISKVETTFDVGKVIEEITEIFSLSSEKAQKEYQSWYENTQMQLQSGQTSNFKPIVQESGSEVRINYENELIIQIK